MSITGPDPDFACHNLEFNLPWYSLPKQTSRQQLAANQQ
jgi:hypothetical protein